MHCECVSTVVYPVSKHCIPTALKIYLKITAGKGNFHLHLADMADNKEAPTGAVVKRSFDIAFLTGTVERLPEEPVIKKEETPEEPPQSYQPKSAFQKVGSGQPTITGNSSAPKGIIEHSPKFCAAIILLDTAIPLCSTYFTVIYTAQLFIYRKQYYTVTTARGREDDICGLIKNVEKQV